VAETLLLYNSSHADYASSSCNKNKAKGSNIGDAIVELLVHGGMPSSVIEARLVDGKKLELGAVGNQNKCVLRDCLSLRLVGACRSVFRDIGHRLSRSLQKLQRAGIVSKVSCTIDYCVFLGAS
jgi:hypothetical protein